MSHDFSSVAIVMRPWITEILLDIVCELKRRHGSKIHAYVDNKVDVTYFEKYVEDGTLDSVTFCGHMNTAHEIEVENEQEVLRKARHFETKIGRTINSVSMSRKAYGAPFYLGGYGFPKSKVYKNSSTLQIINGFVNEFEFWEKEFADKSITLMMNGWVSNAVIARANGIPFRRFMETPVGSAAFWVCDEYLQNPMVEHRYNELLDQEFEPINLTSSYASSALGNKNRLKLFGNPLNLLPAYFRLTRDHVYSFLRGRFKAYPWWSEIQYETSLHTEFWKFLYMRKGYKASDLRATPYVYFPLNREPEHTYMMMSPEFLHQLPALASIVRDLPSGFVVGVKEHIAGVGSRSPKFYEQISYFKQTRFLDLVESTFECMRNAEIVATVAGTAGIEASVIGKPVISFGRHALNRFLPHVLEVTDEAQVTKYLSMVANKEIDLEKAKVDGARFHQAVLDVAFDMSDFEWDEDRKIDGKIIGDAVDLLENSVRIIGVGSIPGLTDQHESKAA
ncbi:hypothetical protein EOI86_16535 [Hwanghaeella grinnelliae]|uniref:Polysaccharide biosynthesis protein n=1 Tax=Hwanghaeella grinnelliae TaxID=2500179 RepID=A0A3S2Y3D5_9PROT|nr:hypothetical protein [Hwanghaeella grinnelliae]RVU36771.1 hypothetical protein EOI86_16535 [Hwanghaeella grinnelliae]